MIFLPQGKSDIAPSASDIIFATKTREANITRRSRIPLRSNRTRPKANITEKTTCFCKSFFLVPVTGLEPVRCCHRGILSPLRLPIPPHRRAYAPLCGVLCNYNIIVHSCQAFFTIGIRESNRFIGGAIYF